jgi:hypothetical protein
VGGVAGGYAGKAVAEAIDPTVEEAYWRENYRNRPYYDTDLEYDEYAPAYRYGWEARGRYHDRTWDDIEPELESGWSSARSSSTLGWAEAREASRDAWNRIDQREQDLSATGTTTKKPR